MELDGDEEEPDDADIDASAPSHLKMEDAEDEEETKARVEKMELKTVSDVRSVAGLMKQLEPVLEVSTPRPQHMSSRPLSFTSCSYSHPNLSAVLQKIDQYKNLPSDKQTKNIGSVEDNPEYKLLTQIKHPLHERRRRNHTRA